MNVPLARNSICPSHEINSAKR